MLQLYAYKLPCTRDEGHAIPEALLLPDTCLYYTGPDHYNNIILNDIFQALPPKKSIQYNITI